MKIIFFLFLTSLIFITCSKNNTNDILGDYKNLDERELGILETKTVYHLDTVRTDSIQLNLVFSNSSKIPIKNFQIKNNCNCTVVGNYDKIIKPFSSINANVQIDVSDQKGNFNKNVIVLGSFYPFIRNIEILGYKKQ